ncbi:unnamed protein product [Caretta caretta]
MAFRRSQVLSFLREEGYPVVFLQETHMDPTAKGSWRLECGDRVYFRLSMVRQARVATLFSTDLWPKVLGVAEAVPGRLLHLQVRTEELLVNLVNVYAPTLGLEQLQFYQQASAFLGTLDSHECLVCARLFGRDYTRGTSRCRNVAIEQLEREVLELERRLAASPEDPLLCGVCWEKREELQALKDHRAQGAFVQSCIRLLREMDRGFRFVVQDRGDLALVEACQAIYSAASSTQVNWVKSSGLAVEDWRQASSLPPVLQTIRWSAGQLLYLGVYLSATRPSPPENWEI